MPQSARVSVIIPAYNCSQTLVQTVTSIRNSSEYARAYMGIDLRTEIIVVDDGSTDDTASIMKTIGAADYPKHIVFKGIYGRPNQGAGRARQEGTNHATAPFLCYLDADDEFLPRHLGLCIQTLLEDRSIGYVWTQRKIDVPIHPTWAPSLDRSTVMNLCVRKIWHELIKGFPEHPDFRTMSTEDSFYRIMLEKITAGKLIEEKTVMIHFSPGNSLDRQKVKFNTPIHEWDSSKEEFEPSDGIMTEFNERMAYIDSLMSEMGR